MVGGATGHLQKTEWNAMLTLTLHCHEDIEDLHTFLEELDICDGKDAFLVTKVTLVPVSINLTSHSESITL